jgi:hypothetical protein
VDLPPSKSSPFTKSSNPDDMGPEEAHATPTEE